MGFHDFRVLAIVPDRREDKLVVLLAIVLQNETDLFPLAHLDARRFETHLSTTLEHFDVHDASRLFRIPGLASGKAAVGLMRATRTRQADPNSEESSCKQRDSCGREDASDHGG